MAELADALDLGSNGHTRTGSIPATRTRKILVFGRGFFNEVVLRANEDASLMKK